MAIVDGHIRCSGCKNMLPCASFPGSAVKRGNGKCSQCSASYRAERLAVDPEAVRANQRASSRRWYANNRAVHRARVNQSYDPIRAYDLHLQRTYGISLEDYERLLESQGGGCALCGKRQRAEKLRLAVDHDHETGRVRGLLCHHCNQALGALGDTVEGLRRAISYIERAQQPLPPRTDAPSIRINLLQGVN